MLLQLPRVLHCRYSPKISSHINLIMTQGYFNES